MACLEQYLSVFELISPKNDFASADRNLSMNRSSAQVDHCSADPSSYYFTTKVTFALIYRCLFIVLLILVGHSKGKSLSSLISHLFGFLRKAIYS